MEERPIEKTLRAAAAAAKRRAEPGKIFALHPVDRKALQAEVANVYGSNAEPAKSAQLGWAGLWPQIAWSFALVLGLAVAVTMMLPRSGSSPGTFTLARNEVAKEMPGAPGQSLAQRLGSTSPPATRLVRNEQEADRVKSLATDQDQAKQTREAIPGSPPALAPAAAPTRPTELAAGGGTKLDQTQRFRSRYGLDDSAAPPPATASSSSTLAAAANEPVSTPAMKAKDGAGVTTPNSSSSLADSKVQITNQARSAPADSFSDKQIQRADTAKHELAANALGTAAPSSSAAPASSAARGFQPSETAPRGAESLTLRQQFVQTTAITGAIGGLAQSAPAILNTFDFEQTGSAIRITDQDGSVYLGRTQLPPAVNRRFVDRKADNGTVSATSAYFFNQNSSATLFTVSGTNLTSGQLVTFQGQLLGSSTRLLNEAVEMKRSSSDGPAANALISTNVQLSGTLRIGTNIGLEFHARPTQTTRK